MTVGRRAREVALAARTAMKQTIEAEEKPETEVEAEESMADASCMTKEYVYMVDNNKTPNESRDKKQRKGK